MTEELKTLKELKWTDVENHEDTDFISGHQESQKQTRQEAIKWIKYFQSQSKKAKEHSDEEERKSAINDEEIRINLLEVFFNITEEDLK